MAPKKKLNEQEQALKYKKGKAERARIADKKSKPLPKPKPKSLASKVGARAGTIAREVRDIPTAAANIYESRSIPAGGVARFAKKDLKKQIKEVGSAIKSGKKGTEAATQTGITRKEKKNRVGAGGLDYYISRPKKPRK